MKLKLKNVLSLLVLLGLSSCVTNNTNTTTTNKTTRLLRKFIDNERKTPEKFGSFIKLYTIKIIQFLYKQL